MKMRKRKSRDDGQTSLIGTIFRIQTESKEREREKNEPPAEGKADQRTPLFPSLLGIEEGEGDGRE